MKEYFCMLFTCVIGFQKVEGHIHIRNSNTFGIRTINQSNLVVNYFINFIGIATDTKTALLFRPRLMLE